MVEDALKEQRELFFEIPDIEEVRAIDAEDGRF